MLPLDLIGNDCFFVPFGHEKLDLSFVHGRAEKIYFVPNFLCSVIFLLTGNWRLDFDNFSGIRLYYHFSPLDWCYTGPDGLVFTSACFLHDRDFGEFPLN